VIPLSSRAQAAGQRTGGPARPAAVEVAATPSVIVAMLVSLSRLCTPIATQRLVLGQRTTDPAGRSARCRRLLRASSVRLTSTSFTAVMQQARWSSPGSPAAHGRPIAVKIQRAGAAGAALWHGLLPGSDLQSGRFLRAAVMFRSMRQPDSVGGESARRRGHNCGDSPRKTSVEQGSRYMAADLGIRTTRDYSGLCEEALVMNRSSVRFR
jgi:hypothetical protein